MSQGRSWPLRAAPQPLYRATLPDGRSARCLTTSRPRPRPASGEGRDASAADQRAAAVLERAERLGRRDGGADLHVVPRALRLGGALDLEQEHVVDLAAVGAD